MRWFARSLAVLAMLAGLAARAADPQPSVVRFAPTEVAGLETLLRDASTLLRLQGEEPVAPAALIARAVFVRGRGIDAELGGSERVGGTATAPRITLGSEPEVPQDEVLSRLLFGRSQATLTPAQLIQLAQAAAELAGIGPSGPGILDQVRRRLGLDRLTVGADQATGGPTVEAGRYLADGVYLGARRAADGSTRATVQIEVLPNVQVEADVGGEGEGRVGLSWGIDY